MNEGVLEMLRGMGAHERIGALRRLRGMSQQDLADKVGVERGTISAWEADPEQDRAHSPSPPARAKLARFFGIPAYVFTPDYGPQNKEEMRGEQPVDVYDEFERAYQAEIEKPRKEFQVQPDPVVLPPRPVVAEPEVKVTEEPKRYEPPPPEGVRRIG